MNSNYDITDDGSCIRIRLNGEIVAIVEDYYFGGHVHAVIRQLLEHIDYTWSAPAGFNRGLGLERLEQLTRLVHDDIANDVTTELIDPEEQKTYNELYQIHTNLMKEFRDI